MQISRTFRTLFFEKEMSIRKTVKYMSHFSYVCKMQYPLNLVLENWEYLLSYLTFCIVILDYGLKLHKLSIHTLVILQK